MIRIDDLTKVVGARTLFAIDHLSIGACDKVGLIGDNGTGKTTFLRILSSLDTDYAGRVQMNDEISYLLNNSEDELGFIYQRRFQQNCSSSPGEQQRLKLEHLLVDNKAFLLIDEPTSHLDISY